MLILTFEDREEEILNHIISYVSTGARAFQVIENAKTNLSFNGLALMNNKKLLIIWIKNVELLIELLR